MRQTERAAAKPAADRAFRVSNLARVEGEGGLRVRVKDGEVTEVELRIFEPPRFFEALLRDRDFTEAPDLTARICGICPVAYQTSASQALEQICGVELPEELRRLRRLLYCGEWIESHALHIYLLHAPDFLGYPGAVEFARDNRAVVERGLRLKKAGNALMTLLGGRSVHPVNVRVGGFYRLPERAELLAIRPAVAEALDDAVATVDLVSGFDFPEIEHDQEYLALRPDNGEYPIENGRLVTSSGLDFPATEFESHVREEHVPWSTALHAHLDDFAGYLVGPLARYSLNSDRLSPIARGAADRAGLGATCRNPFRSIVVRAVETVQACEDALAIIDTWAGAPYPAVPVTPSAGVGCGVSEAPRGVLYHRYEIAGDGTILSARIVPPTSQNQASIESDLRAVVQGSLDLPDDALRARCEQAIRNYDPCISCATHFLDLRIERD